MSSSAVSKPIFEIKATEYKKKIPTSMLSRSGKNVQSLVIWLQVSCQKAAVVVLLIVTAQADQDVLSLGYQKGEVNMRYCQKSSQKILLVQ